MEQQVLHDIVIKFAGDSGDGMQLTGAQFSEVTACAGLDICTFPDYPAEIRAPKGTIAGVSGYQIHVGSDLVKTPGDLVDVLVVMNPAALMANIHVLKPGAIIIADSDSFTSNHIDKAGFSEDPFHDVELNLRHRFKVIEVPVTSMTAEALKDIQLDKKYSEKVKNQFVAGMLYWMFNSNITQGEKYIRKKLKSTIADANIVVLHKGYDYAETMELISPSFCFEATPHKKGLYRNINGNTAISWGLIAAAENAGIILFIASYPITPASEILQELSLRKSMGVKSFQAEDEIAAVCSAIGASFAGHLGVTSTSGPGMSLKTEGIGMAVMAELPLVVINVMRGGPSTGLPTKTEQSDLNQALYGRNGESPCVVIAPTTPGHCFEMSYWAAKIAMEHMVPVILLSNGYLGNSMELWKIPDMDKMPPIVPPFVKENDTTYTPYKRDIQTFARTWAIPGQQGMRHHLGTVEKHNISGEISYDGQNHEEMIRIRAKKVERVANSIPMLEVDCDDPKKDVLIVGWGGTAGVLSTAAAELRSEGYSVSHVQFAFINPLPLNTKEILHKYKIVIVCEINAGQFVNLLRSKIEDIHFYQYNRVQGRPFYLHEIKEMCLHHLVNLTI